MRMDSTRKKRLRRGKRRWLWFSAATGSALSLSAQPPVDDQARWLTMYLSDAYLKLDAEAEQQNIKSSGGGGTATSQRYYLAPAIGVGLDGSVYHPNLLTYQINAEPGYMWQDMVSQPGGSSKQDSFLQNYRASGSFFGTKPFATTVFGDERHLISNYDFFNQAVVDAQDWGVNSGYRSGPVPVSVSYQDSHQDSTALAQHTLFDQRTFNLHAQNDRNQQSTTDLDYRFGQYDQTSESDGSAYKTSSTYNFVTLNDLERFGADNRFSLDSLLTYNRLEEGTAPSDTLTAQANLGVEHTPHLRSGYSYNFIGYSDPLSDSEVHSARAGLSHQLYESLATGVDAHGSLYHAGSGSSSLDSRSGGFMASANYSKRLGGWGFLSLGDGIDYDHISQDSSSGLIPVPNESVVLDTTYVPLKQPNDADPITVTTVGGIVLTEGFDYQLDRASNPWGIRVISTSTLVHPKDTVNVTYYVRANPTGGYETLQNQFSARLDLFQRMLSFHGHYNTIQNFTNAPGFVLQDLEEMNVGAEFYWKGFHAGADYTDTRSSLYSFRTKMLSEGYTLFARRDSTLSIDLHQRWTDYSNQGLSVSYYDAIARFECHPYVALTWSLEGGFQRQRGGGGLDQDSAVIRSLLTWKFGKLDASLGYSYENQDFNGENRDRHFVFLRTTRKF